jgi:hypothetical protein
MYIFVSLLTHPDKQTHLLNMPYPTIKKNMEK